MTPDTHESPGPLTLCKHDFPETLCPYCKQEEIDRLKAENTKLRDRLLATELAEY